MINGQKFLGLITARGGSKGVPGKNIRLAAGKPLIVWTIEAGKASRYLDRLILSSDDQEICDIAQNHGCDVPFKRESSLARDNTPSVDVVLDALDQCPGYYWVVLLQPTSPLRTAADIDGTIEMCIKHDAPTCVTVCEVEQNPYWMYYQRESRLYPVIDKPTIQRRQDLPPVYILNGAVYVAQAEWLRKHRVFVNSSTMAYEMDAYRSLDIDVEQDFITFESRILEIKRKS